MTKIKNFRITLRPREMARWLKKERGLETTPELEMSIEQAAKESKRWVEPAAIYTTLTRSIAEKTTAISFPNKAIAVSVVAVSIGPGLESQRQAEEAGAPRESLLSALQQESLAQSLHFVVRLIQDQAKDEDCDMSSPVSVEEAQVASSLATLLGVQRIGIALDASIPSIPSHVRLAWLFWTPVGKGASRRTEKVAA